MKCGGLPSFVVVSWSLGSKSSAGKMVLMILMMKGD